MQKSHSQFNTIHSDRLILLIHCDSIPIGLTFGLLRRFPVEAPDNDDADTEAPTEESDYDPFAGAQVRRKKLE